MTYLLLTNEIFYLSIFSVVVLCYGLDQIFSKGNKKSAVFYTILGVFTLSTILISTFSQYNSFRNLPFNIYQGSDGKYEAFSIDPIVEFDKRFNAARKIYIDTGRIVNYLNNSREIVPYQVSDEDKEQRLARVANTELIDHSIEENLLMCELIFWTIFSLSLFGGILILIRIKNSRLRVKP